MWESVCDDFRFSKIKTYFRDWKQETDREKTPEESQLGISNTVFYHENDINICL